MPRVTQTIDVDVPVARVFDHWANFEEFPRFMDGVERVERRGDDCLRWVTRQQGEFHTFETAITELDPGSRIAWKSLGHPRHHAVVTFLPVNSARTRVNLQLTYDAHLAAADGSDAQAKTYENLERFKSLVERGTAEVWA